MFFYSIWFESCVAIAVTIDSTHCISKEIPITSEYLYCMYEYYLRDLMFLGNFFMTYLKSDVI